MILDGACRQRLLTLARSSIEHGLATSLPTPVRRHDWPDALWLVRASFVTLTRGGRLRGCRGRIDAVQPLPQDVAVSAVEAALDDPRFPPVTASEVPELDIAISILTPPEQIRVGDMDALKALLRPHEDGVFVVAGHHRATFLPKVWAQLPDASDFLAALWEKAGLRPDAWPEGIRIERYAAIDFSS